MYIYSNKIEKWASKFFDASISIKKKDNQHGIECGLKTNLTNMYVRTDVTFPNHFRTLSIFPTHPPTARNALTLRNICGNCVSYNSWIGSEIHYVNFSEMRNPIDKVESDAFRFGAFVDAEKRGRPSFGGKLGWRWVVLVENFQFCCLRCLLLVFLFACVEESMRM